MSEHVVLNAKKQITVIELLCYMLLFSYIVFGNALTFNLGGRLPIKLSEIVLILASVPLILKEVLLPFLNGKKVLGKSIKLLFYWGLLSVFLYFFSSFMYGFTFNDNVYAALYLVRFLFTAFVGYLIAVYFKESGKVRRALKFTVFCYFLVGVIGIFQYIFYPTAFDWYEIFWSIGVYFPDADPHLGRLVSTYFDPNYLASCLTVPIAILMFFFAEENGKFFDRSAKKTFGTFFLFLFFLIIIFLTESRSGILGVSVLLFFYLFLTGFRKNKINLSVFSCLLLICLVALVLVLFSDISVFERIRKVFLGDASADLRFISWKKGFEILTDTLFLGIGYNNYGTYAEMKYGIEFISSGYGNDSSLLLILVTTGIIGFVLFMVHLVDLLRTVKSIKIMLSLTVSALIICNFNNLLFYGLWVLPFYFVNFLLSGGKNNEGLDNKRFFGSGRSGSSG